MCLFCFQEGADYDVPENNLLNIQDEFSTQLNESTNQPIEQNSNEQVETAVEAMESKQYGTNEQGRYKKLSFLLYFCSI